MKLERSKWMEGSKRGGLHISEEIITLFQTMEKLEGSGQYDDVFLVGIIRFHQLWPESELYEYWYARYALAHRNTEVALEYAQKAYKKRKVSRKVVQLMADVYHARGEYLSAWFCEAFCCKHYGRELHGDVPRDFLEDFRWMASHAMSEPWKAPALTDAVFFDRQASVILRERLLIGRFLTECPWGKDRNAYRYWCGVWNRRGNRNVRGKMLEKYASQGVADRITYCDVVFDIMKSCETDFVRSAGGTVIFPLAGLEENQKIHFAASQLDKKSELGKFEYTFFRVDGEAEISSEKPFVLGKPILLEHHPERRKLVLNILLDGFNWSEVQKQEYRCIPNMMAFFRQGIIFDNNYTVAEYTYPSLATIETGCTMQRIQVFNPKAMVRLENDCKTISECMSEAGYHCVCVMGNGQGIYNGATRGYDRLLVSQDAPYYAFDGIERAIHHLEAFSECDNFLFLHVLDTHPCGKGWQNSLEIQTKTPLDERLENINDVVSVWLAKSRMNAEQNRLCIREVDRLLGSLFEYILTHYKEDEYIVHLYSDHGNSVYSDQPWFLSEEQSHAALMMRGGGIPSLGRVEELTSCLDIYPCIMRNAGLPQRDGIDGNLPAALGGHERKYVISNSIYPLQPFKLCIRDQLYEFRLETDAATEIDGTVDFSSYSYALYTRDRIHERLDNPCEEQRFLNVAEEYVRGMQKIAGQDFQEGLV